MFVYVRTSCLCIGFNPGDVWCCFRPVCRFRYFCVFWLGGGGVTFPHVFVHFHYLSHSRISLEMNFSRRGRLSRHVDYALFVYPPGYCWLFCFLRSMRLLIGFPCRDVVSLFAYLYTMFRANFLMQFWVKLFTLCFAMV